MKSLADQTLYEVLEVPPDAPPGEIERAYERVQALFGPGALATYTLMGPDDAALLGARLEEARTILLDPESRARYDATLSETRTPVPRAGRGEDGTAPLPPIIPPRRMPEPVVIRPRPARAATAADLRAAADAILDAITAPTPPRRLPAPAAAEPQPVHPPIPLERVATPIPLARPAPPLQLATPIPRATPLPRPLPLATPVPRATPPPQLVALATPVPRATPAPLASPGPLATPVPISPPFAAVAVAPPPPPAAAVEAPPAQRPHKPVESVFVHENTRFTGDVLRRAREARGLSVPALCERTKITRHHIENLEADRYEKLPAAVYLRGILMAIAKELRLDGQKVARSYLDAMASAAPPPPPPRAR